MGLDEATRAYEQSQYNGRTFQREKGFEIFCPQYFPTRSQKNGSQDCFTELCHQTSQENFFKCLIIFWSEDFTGTCVCACVCVQGRVIWQHATLSPRTFHYYTCILFWHFEAPCFFLSVRSSSTFIVVSSWLRETSMPRWLGELRSVLARHGKAFCKCWLACSSSASVAMLYIIVHIHHIWAAVKSTLPVVFVVAAIFEWSWFGWLSASLLRYSKMGPPAHLMVS